MTVTFDFSPTHDFFDHKGITDVRPPGSFAAYAVALTPAACSFVENSVFNSIPPLNEPASFSP
ncbi:MAG: hypothetical protein DMG39_20100 [Acidobacteria bacterium]|nr:MAG: hypothetical protein DMG39_20100 [Acidobacteriota bacterium]